MAFTTFDFAVFFIITAALYFLSPARWHWLVLLGASAVFYGWHNPLLLFPLLLPALATYFLAIEVAGAEAGPRKKRLLFLGIVLATLGLATFKYADFVGSSLFHLGSLFSRDLHFKPLHFLLPIGISFYTLRMISYLIDVYRGIIPAERHAGFLLLHVAFFPELLAGPIERAAQFLPQLKKKPPFDWQRVCDGGKQIAWGVFKKLVIADRLAVIVDKVYGDVADYSGPSLLVATLSYSIQIYCDFSAYSDMAIGLSRILGFKAMENFRAPYFGTSIGAFWTRWHISLSTWLRDYLFLPVSYAVMRRIKGERLAGIRVETWGYSFSTLFTMFLCGLWHGASWTMAAWGLLHGVFLVASHASRKLRKRIVRFTGMQRAPVLHRAFRIACTFSLVSFSWIFFRAETFSDAWTVITHLFQGTFAFAGRAAGMLLFSLDLSLIRKLFWTLQIEPYSLLVLTGAIIVLVIVDRWIDKGNIGAMLKLKPAWIRFSIYYMLIMSILLFSVWDGGSFIYFKF